MDEEFNKQREYLINKVRKFLLLEVNNYELEITDNEICAILSEYRYINYYFRDTYEYKNLLLQRKLLNRYARYHEIRFEDSCHIISRFLNGIKPLNDELNFIRQQYSIQPKTNLVSSKEPKGSKVTQEPYQIEEYIPIFI